MKIELVNEATGQRTDLRFISGLQIALGDVSPEVRVAFVQMLRERDRWLRHVTGPRGVSSEVVRGLLRINDERP